MASGYIEDVAEITRLTRTTKFLPDSPNAKLSTTQVLAMAQSIARTEIDTRLRVLGVTTPVSKAISPSGFFVLKDINALGAACRVDRVNFTEVAPNGRVIDPWQCVEFDKLMTALTEGELNLIDVEGMPEADNDLACWNYENERFFTGTDKF
jgi:hypothetical protein